MLTKTATDALTNIARGKPAFGLPPRTNVVLQRRREALEELEARGFIVRKKGKSATPPRATGRGVKFLESMVREYRALDAEAWGVRLGLSSSAIKRRAISQGIYRREEAAP